MIYLDTKHALIEWDAAIQCVRLVWRSYTDGRDYREATNKILEVLVTHGGNKLLADTRNMKVMAPEDQDWLWNDWVPRSKKAGLKYNAVILPKSAVAKLSLQRLAARGSGVKDTETAGYFDNEDDARKWLRERR